MAAATALERAMGVIRRKLLPFLFVLYVVAYLDRVNLSFAAAGIERDLGLNTARYGLAAGIFFAGYVLLEVPSNLVLHRVGARRWIGRILLSWGLVATSMAFVANGNQFIALRFLLGVAEAGFFPGIVLYLSQWVPAGERARTLSAFLLAIPVAGLIGGPISGALLSMHGLFGLEGWRWLFLLEGLPAIALAFAVWRWLPNQPGAAAWLQADEAAALEQALAAERADLQASGRQVNELAAGLRDRRVWLLALLGVSGATGVYGFSFWIPRFVADGLPQVSGSPALVNLISAIPYGMAVVAMLLVAASADRRQTYRTHMSAALAVAGGALVLAIGSSGLLRLVWITVAAAANFASLGVFWAMPSQFLGGRAAAGGIASINSVGNIGGFLAPIVMGRLMLETGGDSLALSFLAAALLLASLVAQLIRTQGGANLSAPAPKG